MGKFDNAWWVNSTIREVALSPKSGAMAAKLMRPDSVRIWHDQLLVKPVYSTEKSREATRVGWHRDYSYWDSISSSNMITIWYPLQDSEPLNGTINFVRGSNKLRRFNDEGEFYSPELESERKRISLLGFNWEEVPAILPAGAASFHHALTIHGSSENMGDEERISLVVHYMPGDSVLQPNGYPHTHARMQGPFSQAGDSFDDSRHPVVWAKDWNKEM